MAVSELYNKWIVELLKDNPRDILDIITVLYVNTKLLRTMRRILIYIYIK
jgi:hypothetical protein